MVYMYDGRETVTSLGCRGMGHNIRPKYHLGQLGDDDEKPEVGSREQNWLPHSRLSGRRGTTRDRR